MRNYLSFLPAMALAALPALGCDLKVESAWIRTAPGSATTLAGYAVLSNAGNKPLGVASAQSAAFERVEMHESLTENGMSKMRPVDKLELAAGGTQTFAPGGKHFMLINPKAELRSGDVVSIKFKDSSGCETVAGFKVSAGPPGMGGMDHAAMDHSSMDHSKMGH